MGDINLLGMIRKLKSSLSGFVGKNDKATKSAFGVVKIGDNISVSSGKISVPVATEDTYGVVKAGSGGCVVDVLWSGNLTSDFVDITASLSHPLTDYKFLFCSRVNGVNVEPCNLLYVADMSDGTNNQNTMYMGTNTPATIRLGDGTVSIKSSSTVTGVKLIGIK